MAGDGDLSEGEHSVLLLHPHWKTVLLPFLLLVLVVVVAAVVVALIWTGIPFLRWRTTTYELTTRRFRLRSGILSRAGRDFPLVRISDISYSSGPVDRLLGTGSLIIESAGEHGQLVLHEIPEVRKVQATLFQLVEDEQARLAREDHGP